MNNIDSIDDEDDEEMDYDEVGINPEEIEERIALEREDKDPRIKRIGYKVD